MHFTQDRQDGALYHKIFGIWLATLGNEHRRQPPVACQEIQRPPDIIANFPGSMPRL